MPYLPNALAVAPYLQGGWRASRGVALRDYVVGLKGIMFWCNVCIEWALYRFCIDILCII